MLCLLPCPCPPPSLVLLSLPPRPPLGCSIGFIITGSLLIGGGLLCTITPFSDATGITWWLTFWRFVLGFGIGGEYPISASSSAENSATKNRGQTVALTFSMQGIGNFAGAFIGNLLVQGLARNTDGHYENSHLQVIWRVLFFIGAVPAAAAMYGRIKMSEPRQYQKLKKQRQRSHDPTKRVPCGRWVSALLLSPP